MKTPSCRVAFRVDRLNNEVSAVLPDLEATPGTWVCYARLGQHAECSQSWYYAARPAKPKEFATLLRELRQIYESGQKPVKLVIVRRIVRRSAL